MGGQAFQARRALDLAALTARLKPCPSTTVPISCPNPRVFPQAVKSCPSQNTQCPEFFRKLLSHNLTCAAVGLRFGHGRGVPAQWLARRSRITASLGKSELDSSLRSK